MEDLIVKGRGKGKTYGLILKSAATGYPIITPHNVDYIISQARDMKVRIPEPISCQNLTKLRNNLRGTNNKVLLDEADTIIEMLIGVKVDSMTITPENLIL